MTRISTSLVREVVEATPRKRLSGKVRSEVLAQFGGRCARCFLPLPTRLDRATGLQRFIVEFDHVTPLELGGADDATNIVCLDAACHRLKTNADLKAISKARRLRAKHADPSTRAVKRKRKIESPGFQTKLTRGFDNKVKERKS